MSGTSQKILSTTEYVEKNKDRVKWVYLDWSVNTRQFVHIGAPLKRVCNFNGRSLSEAPDFGYVYAGSLFQPREYLPQEPEKVRSCIIQEDGQLRVNGITRFVKSDDVIIINKIKIKGSSSWIEVYKILPKAVAMQIVKSEMPRPLSVVPSSEKPIVTRKPTRPILSLKGGAATGTESAAIHEVARADFT